MQTIQLKSEVTLRISDLLKGMEQLSLDDLEIIQRKIITLRVKKIAPSHSKKEAKLLERIHLGLPAQMLLRYDALDEKRQDKTLTDEEYQELMGIIEKIEEYDTNRLGYLAELCEIRSVPLGTLVKQLGIRPRQNA